jgi:tetraacyldisaccharide-1-P 4'-kinase
MDLAERVSFGNYTWGGTGKTPFVIFLSKLLVSRGYQPVILSRGYGHQDEAKMLLQRQVASHVIITGSNREAAFHRLGSTNAPSTVAILDDGLQHWRLKRQCNILMVNAALAFGINGHLIPRGSLREPPEEAVARCTCIVLHHCSQVSDVQLGQLKSWFHKYCPEKPVLTSCMVAKSLYLVTCDGQKLPHACDTIANQDMVLCCGIEYPSGFLKTVVDYCRPRQVSIESLGDHHWFRLQDLWNIVHKWNSVYTHWNLLVTEKDYYRNEKVFHQLVNKDWTSNVRVFVVQADLQVHSGIHELEKLLDELGLGPT